ncbi:DUF1707 SHOCT-like domain-containing protein [Qaidamihabitans albus]|uniref:DUF1707 SHOCT-like domain-containing protein n=1 Tax=Qaidamihabitans albus TaxID=2795733 RepID=UPI0018F1F60A|nr:DUF1707 domain-containing protein [Qaidamihabitans albus]
MGESEEASGTEVPDELQRARNLRVSDREREHVVGLLQKAIGRGMLDLDEFTERTDIALAARTRGELNAVLADLPGLVHRDAVAPAPPLPSAAPAPGIPVPAGERLELKAHGSSLVRKGRWYVPPQVLVRNKYGETKLDFSEAELSAPVIHVELDTKWNSVAVTVPDNAVVDTNGITEVKWGSLDDKTNSNGKPGTPRFVFSGRVHGGSLTLRYPRRGLFS